LSGRLEGPMVPEMSVLFRKEREQSRGRERRWVLIGVVLSLGAVWLWLAPDNEASYQGKKVGEWLSYFQSTTANQLMAGEAFKLMGTNAIPALLQRLAKSDSPITVALIRTKRRWPWLKFPVEGAAIRFDNVCRAFRAMGATNAQNAIPQLVELWKGTSLLYSSDERAQPSARILRDIGAPAVPSLIKALTNADPAVRFHACYTLGEIGRGEAAGPLCHVLRNDAHAPTRCRAAIALSRMASKANVCVSALAVALGDPAAAVRMNAAYALIAFGKDAQSAIPALRQAVQAENAMPERSGNPVIFREKSKSQVISALAAALKAIDPGAAIEEAPTRP
jgi:HEAT repeat protein